MNEAPFGLAKEMLENVQKRAKTLYDFLQLNDLHPENAKLSTVMDEVMKLKVMLNDKKYAGLIFDQNGYVIKVFRLDDFVIATYLPLDVEGGYYKYIDGKFVLDDERQRQLGE